MTFQKGHGNSNTGRTHWKKGQHISPSTQFVKGQKPWCTGKKRPEMIGSKNPAWKGGKTKADKLLRNSAEYGRWREKVFERDDYTCQICNKRGVYLNADHIKPWAYFPKLRFDVNNGRTLCVPCHKETDNYLWKSAWGHYNHNGIRKPFKRIPSVKSEGLG